MFHPHPCITLPILYSFRFFSYLFTKLIDDLYFWAGWQNLTYVKHYEGDVEDLGLTFSFDQVFAAKVKTPLLSTYNAKQEQIWDRRDTVGIFPAIFRIHDPAQFFLFLNQFNLKAASLPSDPPSLGNHPYFFLSMELIFKSLLHIFRGGGERMLNENSAWDMWRLRSKLLSFSLRVNVSVARSKKISLMPV